MRRVRCVGAFGPRATLVESQSADFVASHPRFPMRIRLDSRRNSRGYRLASFNACKAFTCEHARYGVKAMQRCGLGGREPMVGMSGKDQPNWRRSSLCSFDKSCVEVSLNDGEVYVRDSKNPSQAQLRFTVCEWAAFLGGVLRGDFDIEQLHKLSTVNDSGQGSPPAAIA